MDMQISFPGGKRVDANYKGFSIATDQPVKEGGDGSAPEPFSLFLASMGTCAGVYVLYFCEERRIDTQEINPDDAGRCPPADRLCTRCPDQDCVSAQ